MKGVHKVTYVLAKIAEVFSWIAVAACLILFVTSLLAGEWFSEAMLDGVSVRPVNLLGMSVGYAAMGEGAGLTSAEVLNALRRTLPFLSVAGFLCMALEAMVFRNVGLIIKLSHGLTKHAKGATPFQKDVVRMVKEIGYFLVAIPVLELIISALVRLVAGTEIVELSVDLGSVFTALVVFSLAQIFAYGTSMQQDVDGLL